MNKAKAIRQYCLGCAGDSPKEVTLCHSIDCSLWQYRFGYSLKDKRYERRMESARRNHPKEYCEVQQLIEERKRTIHFIEDETQISTSGRKAA